MKLSSFLPQDQVFWYLNKHKVQPLTENLTTDIVVIGGGMAGLSAAQSFQKKGFQVVLLEKNHCGSGASGKSSGFITPNSELSLHDLARLHGVPEAKRLWEFVTSGVKGIQNNITKFNFDCDYQIQDTLVVANTHRKFLSELVTEHAIREQLGYSSILYSSDQLHEILGSRRYKGGLKYSGSFGIHAYHYCLGMKKMLQERGVRIYEETPAIDIQEHMVKTPTAIIEAKHIIVCTDRYATSLDTLKNLVYHAQTFLTISTPLSDIQIKKIFPEKQCMIWDTDLIYHYYRLTGDNRLLLGGADILDTYANNEKHNNTRTIKKLARYFNEKFPEVNIQFEYVWPGLIGISKDLFPLAGHDAKMPSVYYITAATGLPWAAALGAHSAERIINNDTSFDHLFSPYRSFKVGPLAQSILGTRLTFALSNFLTSGSF